MNNFGMFNTMPTGGYYNGMMYQEAPKLTMTQGLTKEQINALSKNSVFSLEISEEDLWRAFCTHRHENKFAVVPDEEGNFVCALCGTKFAPFNGEVAEAKELVNKVVDLMETTKMQALTLPPQTIKDFFQIEPMLKKLPDLFDRSKSDWKRALGVNENYVYGQENNGFAMYQNIINPMGGNGYYDPAVMQPMYGAQMPQQQPMMYAQPTMGQMAPQQPMYGGQMMPQQPMMYAQPMMNTQMMPQQPMMTPAQGNPFEATPTAPAQSAPAQEAVTVTKTLTD